MHLSHQTWTDAVATDVDVILLPVGSLEQHGPHAALDTDTTLAEIVAERGADVADESCAVAPSLPYGISEEHRAFAGTLWLRPETFRSVLRDIVSGCAHHGWDRVVLINGHGGNAAALQEVAARLQRDHVARVATFTWFDAIDLETHAMGHAGPVETAALLAGAADRVQEDRVEEAAADAVGRWGRWVGGTNLAYDTDEFTENGVVGDPSEATAELGEALLDQAARSLSAVIEDLSAA